jgi:2-keto-4-pentenoate hydratase
MRYRPTLSPPIHCPYATDSTPDAPTYAAVFASNVHGSTATFPRGSFRKIGIECEIAYRMARDLTKPPYTREQVADAIEGLVPLIEICDSRLVDRKGATDGWRHADGGGNGGFLVGSLVTDWRSVNTQKQPVTLTFNGKVVADKPGNPNPDLVLAVQVLANQTAGYCGGVRAGQIVTTGSMSGNIATEPGTEVVARFAGLGELKVVLEK